MMRFVEASSVAEACETAAADPWGTQLVSGGTAVVLMLRQGLIHPETLVSVARLAELGGISTGSGSLRIGAGSTLTEVAESDAVRSVAPSLAVACAGVGNVRVRNVATLGGNLAEADYASDPPSVLAALDAWCEVRGPQGSRSVPVVDLIIDFYRTSLEPGEMVTAVHVPLAPARQAYLKYKSRSSEDRPCVGVAARAVYDGEAVEALTVVVGAVAAVPQRHDEITAVALGRPLDADSRDRVASAYAEAIEPLADGRGSAWYRSRMIEVFVRRALAAVAPADEGSRPHATP